MCTGLVSRDGVGSFRDQIFDMAQELTSLAMPLRTRRKPRVSLKWLKELDIKSLVCLTTLCGILTPRRRRAILEVGQHTEAVFHIAALYRL